MTAINGNSITYDTIGNPLTYYIGGLSNTLTWINGRQLASVGNSKKDVYYTYNDEGIRLSKTVNSAEHIYQLNGTQIISETWTGETIFYIYDENGSIAGMRYRTSSYAEGVFDEYLFEKNLQGDVVAIYNASGTKLVGYTYDVWGKVTTTYYNGGASTTAQYNPFRYRGYYYDEDIGFYYLNSRYYDPNVGRFISADGYLPSGMGIISYNLYSYCNNNPIMYTDATGEFPWAAIIIIGVSVIVGIIYGATSDTKLLDNSQTHFPQSKHNITSDTNSDFQEHSGELSARDRIENIFVGATAGLVAGGAIASIVGVAGSLVAGSAIEVISIFGGTGAQTFALGAAAFDIGAVLAGLIGIEIEPIEYEPLN